MNEELKIIISAEVDKLKKNVENAKKSIKDFVKDGTKDLGALNDEFQKYGDAAKTGLATAGAAIAAAGAAILSLSESTKEYRNEQALLVTAFETAGASADTAKNTYNDLYRVLGDTGQAQEAAQHLAQLTTNQKELEQWTNICQGVYATFGASLPIEGLTEAANETAKVGTVTGSLADALNWAGISEDDFNAKLEKCNTEAEREALIRETLSGLYDEAAANYETNASNILAQNEAQAKLDETLASIGETVEPINTMLTELAGDILADLEPYIKDFAENHLPTIKEALEGVGDKIGVVLTWIADNWELVSTLAGIVLGIATALTVVSTAIGVVNAVTAASPVTWIVLGIVAAIAALSAGVIALIKNWDDIKAATIETWDKIKTKTSEAIEKVKQKINDFKEKVVGFFTDIKEKLTAKITEIKENVVNKFTELKDNATNKVNEAKTNIVNKFTEIKDNIKSKISDAKNSVATTFDNIKTKISNTINNARDTVKNAIDKIKSFFNFEWNLPKLKMPSIKITGEWGFNPPSVPKFSVVWNKMGGVFDKPTLFNYAGSLQGIGEAGAEAVVPLENNLGWLDKLATMLSDRMGSGTPIIMQVDGKTFAEVSVNSINQLTRQTGTLPLKIV